MASQCRLGLQCSQLPPKPVYWRPASPLVSNRIWRLYDDGDDKIHRLLVWHPLAVDQLRFSPRRLHLTHPGWGVSMNPISQPFSTGTPPLLTRPRCHGFHPPQIVLPSHSVRFAARHFSYNSFENLTARWWQAVLTSSVLKQWFPLATDERFWFVCSKWDGCFILHSSAFIS